MSCTAQTLLNTVSCCCMCPCCLLACAAETIAIRCYTVAFCLVVVFAEMDWTLAISTLSIFKNWISRGFLYSL